MKNQSLVKNLNDLLSRKYRHCPHLMLPTEVITKFLSRHDLDMSITLIMQLTFHFNIL